MLNMRASRLAAVPTFAIVMLLVQATGCTPTEPNDVNTLETVSVRAKTLSVDAWIADDDEERAKGLMFKTAEDMAPPRDGVERGMLFVFQRDTDGGFWMRNTIINLDIAYIKSDGTIVQTFTMAALDERSYRPRMSYRFALEVNAGVFERHGIGEGDKVEIPDTVLKRQ